MALANFLGFRSDDDFNRSLQNKKTNLEIDEFPEKLNIENIGQFLTLPPFADVKTRKKSFLDEKFDFIFSRQNT